MRFITLLVMTGCGLAPLTDGPKGSDSGEVDPEDVMMLGDLQVSPGSIDFGDVMINASSAEEVTLSNLGSDTISISSAYLDGDTAYSLTAATPVDLASGENTSLVLTFVPDAEQTYTGTLNLLVSGETDFAVIDITGIGSTTGSTGGEDTADTDDPGSTGLSVSTSTISFGTIDIGDVASETVTITNTGTNDIMLQDVASTSAGLVEGDLSTPMLLSGGETADFQVTYTPAEEVSTTAILTIENDSGDEPEIAVTGTGYQNCTICAPLLFVSTGGTASDSMDQFMSTFGLADTHNLVIQNNGDVDLEIDSITLTNDTASASTLICGTSGRYSMSSTSSMVLEAYASTTISVDYTYTGSGVCGEVSLYPLNYENTIVIESNDLSYPEYVITLGGNGIGL
ncbi:MAG: choice-of-anchor D domain-containing protein [Myxococcota bacterium]|nr:choice-of-anchor D domain-containing protein [Myxococcota bacterium]